MRFCRRRDRLIHFHVAVALSWLSACGSDTLLSEVAAVEPETLACPAAVDLDPFPGPCAVQYERRPVSWSYTYSYSAYPDAYSTNITFSYDQYGYVATKLHGSVTFRYEHDVQGSLTVRESDGDGDGTFEFRSTYSYGALGQLLAKTRQQDGLTVEETSYVYTSDGKLEALTRQMQGWPYVGFRYAFYDKEMVEEPLGAGGEDKQTFEFNDGSAFVRLLQNSLPQVVGLKPTVGTLAVAGRPRLRWRFQFSCAGLLETRELDENDDGTTEVRWLYSYDPSGNLISVEADTPQPPVNDPSRPLQLRVGPDGVADEVWSFSYECFQ